MTASSSDRTLADASVILGIVGLLPVLPIIGSVAALVCGGASLRSAVGVARGRAKVGVALGVIGVAAPLVFLFVYCVVLGYPFPIHRYRG